MLAQVRTHTGAICNGVLQLKATFLVEVKNMYLQQGLKPGSLE